ncbi:glycosyltransferase family 39 protein [Streptomyces sp. NPDC051014]|uniref:glycosyltransferase family 39 protein n=1 Tax=Streptomyces sp. NPDC051014 TaxID=3155751 RepID=UPI0033FC2158
MTAPARPAPGTPHTPADGDSPTLALRIPGDRLRRTRPSPIPGAPSAAPGPDGRRRIRVATAVLAAVLVVQTLLTLRRPPAVSPAEALTMTTGHIALSGGAHGWGVPALAGTARSYPVLAALADALGGIDAAATTSLVLTLVTTVLLYGLARRMFDVRVGLCAAALFAVAPSTAALGGSATPEAAGLCLLAVVARLLAGAERAVRWAVVCAVPAVGAAGLTQYWTVLCLPGVLLLAAARGGRGRRPAWPAVVVAVVAPVAGVVAAVIRHGVRLSDGPVFLTAGDRGASFPVTGLATGLLEVVAAAGAMCLLSHTHGSVYSPAAVSRRRSGRGGSRRSRSGRGRSGRGRSGRGRRALWIVALCGAALAPLAAARIHGTGGYGLAPVAALTWFTAPLAGIGADRLLGRHFRFPHAGIALWTAVICLGTPSVDGWFARYPDTAALSSTIAPYGGATGTYLGVPAAVPAYALRATTPLERWTDCGGPFDGELDRAVDAAGCAQAVRAGEFNLIVLDRSLGTAVQAAVRAAMRGNPHYRLLAELPSGKSEYTIWIKTAQQ